MVRTGDGGQGCGLAWVGLISIFVVGMDGCGQCWTYVLMSGVWPE